MKKDVLFIAAAAGLVYAITRSGGANGTPGTIVPRGAEGYVPPPQGFPVDVGSLTRSPSGGYIFPVLPSNQAFTTDPATGQVYVTEIGLPSSGGYVSIGDIARR